VLIRYYYGGGGGGNNNLRGCSWRVRIDKHCTRERHDSEEGLLKGEKKKNKVARTHYHDFLIRGGGI